MAAAGHDDGRRVGQHPPRKRGARCHQIERGLRARHHHFKVVTPAQNAGLPGQDHHGPIGLGLVQRGIEFGNHAGRHSVDLAMGQGEGGDAVELAVRDEIGHMRLRVGVNTAVECQCAACLGDRRIWVTGAIPIGTGSNLV